MIAITGDKFNTSFGEFIVPNELDSRIKVGESISHENSAYIITDVCPPTRPDGRWSFRVQKQ